MTAGLITNYECTIATHEDPIGFYGYGNTLSKHQFAVARDSDLVNPNRANIKQRWCGDVHVLISL